jgi:antitoxin component of RelBE/YafQ-DinJ toxin-antitoxin module
MSDYIVEFAHGGFELETEEAEGYPYGYLHGCVDVSRDGGPSERYTINLAFTNLTGGFAMTKTYFAAPAAGEDEELDKVVAEALRVMTAGGMAPDEAELREMMAERLAETRGVPFEKKATEPEKPKVDIKAGAKKLDTKKVVAAVAAGEAYWYDKPEDARFVQHFFELRTKAQAVGNLLVVGPSGAGKTEGLKRVGEAIGKPFYKLDCATITTEDKWIGHKEIDHDGTRFVMSEHLKWLEAEEYQPGILLYDEVNRVHPSRLNVLLPILDGSQAIFVPDMGRYVKVHPETIIVATANIGTAFGGTFVMDRALRERFNYTLEREFPPVDEEVKVITSATGCPADKAQVICDIAAQTRRKWETGDLESPISTRTLKAAGLLIASGMSVISAMEYTALPLYKADGGAQSERAMVKLILTGKSK